MIKIASIVLITLIFVLFLRETKREFALLLTLCCAIVLFLIVFDDLKDIVAQINSLTSSVTGAQAYASLLLKILGISLLSQFVSDLCRDSGEQALASQSELASKIIILIISLPLFDTVITIVNGLLK
ncbi:MAG: stage III sporulation AC/AD family protein [Clostridiales bacterium]|nr:stage III sporulation AC/AD family protein [Clostridiales bacterium]